MRNTGSTWQAGNTSLGLHVEIGTWWGGEVLSLGAGSNGFLRGGFPVGVRAYAFVVVGKAVGADAGGAPEDVVGVIFDLDGF
jgi:hypothetical protein